jgi:hypothetical protein
VGVAEDGDDFSLQLGPGLIRLYVFAAEDKIHHQRGGDCDEQPKRTGPARR